jgi:oxygen-dependent protoporphyrinogen oxidase
MRGAPVIIVGGGMSGLAAAYELTRRGVPFVLVEASPAVGGVVRTERVGGFVIDAGPDALLTQKPAAIELCRELGIGGRLRPQAQRGTFVVRGGRLRAMPEASVFGIPTNWSPFVTTRAFSARGKCRMAAEYLLPARPAAGDESIASFIGRRFGREAVEYLADPLLAGVHGGDAERLSMQALFPRFLEMERTHGSVIRGCRAGARQRSSAAPAPFVAPLGGLAEMVRALVAALPSHSILTGVRVEDIESTGDGRYLLHVAGAATMTAAAVILATPPRVTAPMVRALDPALAGACARIPSVSPVTVALAYPKRSVRHPLLGTGVVVPRREGLSISALTWVSSKWEGRAPEDHVLLRAYLGGARDPGAVDLPSDAIVARAHRDVAQLLGVTGEPVLARVYRWPHGSPQQEVGHRGLMAMIDQQLAAHAGLFISAAGFRGSGIADCIVEGRRQAQAAAAVTPQRLIA